jgi:hypothetical protein
VTLKPPCQSSGEKQPPDKFLGGQVQRGEKNAPGYVRIFNRGGRVSYIYLVNTYFRKCILSNMHIFEY